MQSTSSFIGKCATVLIGMGLSWATLTNPQAEQVARQICGPATSGDGADLVSVDERAGSLQELAAQQVVNVDFEAGLDTAEPTSVTPVVVSAPPASVSTLTPQLAANMATPLSMTMATPLSTTMATPLSTTMASPLGGSMNEGQRIAELSDMLKELGATYLRVERLDRATSGETRFRVRCDLAYRSDQVKCCLESTRGTAIAAMEDILRAAQHGVEQWQGESAAS